MYRGVLRPSTRWLSRFLMLGAVLALGAVLVLRRSPTEEGIVSAIHPDSLVGGWIQVYPECVWGDTVVLRADGSATGAAATVFAQPLERLSEWRVGDPLGPTDLCFTDQKASSCSGWWLTGDTLALADGQSTVLVRAAFTGERRSSCTSDRGSRARYGDVPTAPKPGGVQRP